MACPSNKMNSYDKYDVRSAADTLIEAQTIRTDKRKGFYEAVKKEVVKKAEAADRAAVVANQTVGLTKKAKVSVGGLFKTPGKGNPHKGKY